MLKNSKITAKLVISGVIFLASAAAALFFIISSFGDSVSAARKERQGIACLKPAAAILQAASTLAVDYSSEDPSYSNSSYPNNQNLNNRFLNNEIARLFEVLESELEKNADSSGARRMVPALRDMAAAMNSGGFEQRQEACAEFIKNAGKLIICIGDESGLTADPGWEIRFLFNAGFKALPQTMARLTRAGLSIPAGPDLEARLIPLREVDYPEAADFLQTAELRFPDSSAEGGDAGAEEILFEMENYRDSLAELITVLETAAGASDPARYGPAILEKLNRANGGAFSLQNAAINRIDAALGERISVCRADLRRAVAAAVLALVPAFIIVIVINVSIFRSVSRLGRLFKDLHNNDLSAAVAVKSRGEFGGMMSAFVRFLENLRTAFASFGRSASMVSSAARDLSDSAKNISAAAGEQSANIAEIVSTMEDNRNLSGQISLKTGEVVNLMMKTEELSQRGSELWEINQDMMQDIWNQNTKIVENIMNLADMISHIDEIISVIDVIADQTKLIAFNASLEASSSGGEGARFAVVAGEIRRFAGGVAESTDEIKEKIEEIQSASQRLIEKANEGSRQIDEGYERMMEQKTVFENIFEVSQNTAGSSRQISELISRQELASSRMFQALKEISAGVQQIAAATASTSKIADNLNVMSLELRETADKYRTGKINGKDAGGKQNAG
jgi:methyl-accepting chemotaxis protein